MKEMPLDDDSSVEHCRHDGGDHFINVGFSFPEKGKPNKEREKAFFSVKHVAEEWYRTRQDILAGKVTEKIPDCQLISGYLTFSLCCSTFSPSLLRKISACLAPATYFVVIVVKVD